MLFEKNNESGFYNDKRDFPITKMQLKSKFRYFVANEIQITNTFIGIVCRGTTFFREKKKLYQVILVVFRNGERCFTFFRIILHEHFDQNFPAFLSDYIIQIHHECFVNLYDARRYVIKILEFFT